MAHGITQDKLDEIGLEVEQVNVLKKCFDGFCQDGSIHVDTIGTILTMMGLRVKPSALKEIIEEVDEDGSGYLEFEEFCQLSAKFLVEEDEGAPDWRRSSHPRRQRSSPRCRHWSGDGHRHGQWSRCCERQ